MGAHVAANCVGKQDKAKFWVYFDRIFDGAKRTPETLTGPGLRKIAQETGMDMTAYDACVKDPAMVAEVRQDIEEGTAVGVNGTPAFFINGRVIEGAAPMESFTTIIDEELK